MGEGIDWKEGEGGRDRLEGRGVDILEGRGGGEDRLEGRGGGGGRLKGRGRDILEGRGRGGDRLEGRSGGDRLKGRGGGGDRLEGGGGGVERGQTGRKAWGRGPATQRYIITIAYSCAGNISSDSGVRNNGLAADNVTIHTMSHSGQQHTIHKGFPQV